MGLSDAWLAWLGPRSDASLIAAGARYAPAIEAGEWWRVLSGSLLHGSLLHLATNTLALLALGRVGEPLFGRRWPALLLAGALTGGGLSLAAGVVRSVGASAAAQAGASALTTLGWRARRSWTPRAAWLLGPGLTAFLLADAAVALTSPHVDVAAHLGGVMCGVVFGLRQRHGPDA